MTIKYRFKPALYIKLLLNSCNEIGLHFPVEYMHFTDLADDEPVGYFVVNNLFSYFFRTEVNVSIFDSLQESYIRNCVSLLRKKLDINKPVAVNFIDLINYINTISDDVWLYDCSAEGVSLVIEHPIEPGAPKYSDIITFSIIHNIFKPLLESNEAVKVYLPFERRFYGRIDTFSESIEFDYGRFKITLVAACKTCECNTCYVFNPDNLNCNDELKRIRAAANTISPSHLSVKTLSDSLGVSYRTLQRLMAQHQKKPSDFIGEFKVELIKKKLYLNNGNIKLTAYEYGFDNLSSFSRFFSSIEGCSPTYYVKNIMPSLM